MVRDQATKDKTASDMGGTDSRKGDRRKLLYQARERRRQEHVGKKGERAKDFWGWQK